MKKLKYFFLVAIIFHSSVSVAQKKPNIIYILTDDLGYGDVGIFFQKQRELQNNRSEPFTTTPNLDKIASEGAILEQYCASPVCAPSRASLLLGVSQGHANVRDNQFDKALENNYTLGNVMQKAGYKTAAIGKWGLQGKGNEAPNWPASPLKRGFDYYYGYIAHGNGHEHYPKEGLYRKPKPVWDNTKEVSNDLDKCYTGDLFTALAKKYITDQQKKKDDRPFFMYLAYDTPHAVLELPTQEYPSGGGLNGGLQWIGKPGHMINTASGTPDSWTHPDYVNATYDHDQNASTPEIQWPDVYKRYATVTRRIDNQVGDLIQLLKDLKIDENTLVVFTSDNGPSAESYLAEDYHPTFFSSYGPFEGLKRDVLEGGMRMPTIAYWPKTIAPNTDIKSPSISYDWMPTFTELAGLPAPVRADGVSLVPSLTGKGKQQESLIYAEYFFKGKTPGYAEFASNHAGRLRHQMQMIRIKDTVAVRYNIQSADDDFEIYNVVNDPKQIHNLANKNSAGLQDRIKARVLQVRMPDADAPRPYDNSFIPSINKPALTNGLNWQSYKGNYPWLANLEHTDASNKGHVTDLDLSKIKSGKDNIFIVEGYLNIPEDGTYTLSLKANGKAFLRIHESAVIDADYGYKPGEERQGQVMLKKGYHPVKIYYSGNITATRPDIDLYWQSPAFAKQLVPKKLFFRD